jgi:hypothetical protein
MKPLGYYASALADHPDDNILDRITEQFGDQLQGLTTDDKAAVLICLVEKATDTRQIVIQDNFLSHENAGDCWGLAQQLTESNQLMLALAILNQLIYGGQS